eukprot:1137313-Pelagomonas_calceolata.AAC.5
MPACLSPTAPAVRWCSWWWQRPHPQAARCAAACVHQRLEAFLVFQHGVWHDAPAPQWCCWWQRGSVTLSRVCIRSTEHGKCDMASQSLKRLLGITVVL